VKQPEKNQFRPLYDYMIIPVEVAEYVLVNRLVNPFATYLRLKFVSRGAINPGSIERADLLRLVDCKQYRTFQSHLGKLKAEKWIGENRKGTLFIRSLDTIKEQLDIYTRTGIIFYPEFLAHVREVLFAAVVGDMLNFQKRARGKRARHKRGATQRQLRPFSYIGLSNELIGKKLCLAISQACHLKHRAEKLGYLTTEQKFRPLAIPESHIRSFKSSYPEFGPRVRFIDDKCYLQQHDKIDVHLTFRQRQRAKNRNIDKR
jgi:hypothetical protein